MGATSPRSFEFLCGHASHLRPVVPQRLRPRPSSLKGLRRRGLIYWGGGVEFRCAYGGGSVTAAKLAPRRERGAGAVRRVRG